MEEAKRVKKGLFAWPTHLVTPIAPPHLNTISKTYFVLI